YSVVSRFFKSTFQASAANSKSVCKLVYRYFVLKISLNKLLCFFHRFIFMLFLSLENYKRRLALAFYFYGKHFCCKYCHIQSYIFFNKVQNQVQIRKCSAT